MKPARQNQGCPSCVSGFCQRMQAALDKYHQAETKSERDIAAKEMAAIMSGKEDRQPFDPKLAAAGQEREQE